MNASAIRTVTSSRIGVPFIRPPGGQARTPARWGHPPG